MITQKTVALYGWITLSLLIVLLVLVWTGQVGAEMRLPVLIVAGVLVISRVVLRFLAARGEARKRGDGE